MLADLPTASNGNYRFLFWEFIFGRPSVGRSTPHQMAISQIPALIAHISFLFWDLIFGRPVVGRSTPPIKWWFHRLLLWCLIFHSHSENSYLASKGVGRSSVGTTPVLMAISHIAALTAHISFLLWELIFGRPGVGRSNPSHQTATIDSYTEGSYLADQVLADLPPVK